jgi:hypothetical protein
MSGFDPVQLSLGFMLSLARLQLYGLDRPTLRR